MEGADPAAWMKTEPVRGVSLMIPKNCEVAALAFTSE